MFRRKHSEQPGIPLASLPPHIQDALAEYAKVYREKNLLDSDFPLRVILPENPGEQFQAMLLAEGSFIIGDEGELDLGIQRD